MSVQPIADDLRRFIVDYIDSVPALEALLLMRNQPARRWTAAMLAAELYIAPRQVADILRDLCTRGLCSVEEGQELAYSARPATPELAAALERLAEAYRTYLVAVTNVIHSKPRPSVRGFSDAFRIRGTE